MSDQSKAAEAVKTAEAETKTKVEVEVEPETEAAPEVPAGEMTPHEKKFLMETLWVALIAPKWTKDTLIDFGKAIFSKKPLKDMTDKEFNQIFPFLRDATLELGKKLVQKKEEMKKAESKEGDGAQESK